MIDIPFGVWMRSIIIEQKFVPAYELIAAIDEVQDENPWYYDIWNFLEKEAYPPGENTKDVGNSKNGCSVYRLRWETVQERSSGNA